MEPRGEFFLKNHPAEILPWGRIGKPLSCALRTPEERLPSGAPKEEFGKMIFEKNYLGGPY